MIVLGDAIKAERLRGFTLLEVLIATAILGSALTLVMAAWGGLVRGRDNAANHVQAMALANQVLVEFSEKGISEIAPSDGLIFNGVKFGYKMKFEPVKDTDWLPQTLTSRLNVLYRVQLDVYWAAGTPEKPGLSMTTHLYKAAQ